MAMHSSQQLRKKYASLLKTVEQKQKTLRRLDREFDLQMSTYEKEAECLAQLKEDKQQRDEADRKIQQMRMRCWQLECSSIIIQRENLSLKTQFDKREFLVRLGVLESRIRQLVESWTALERRRRHIQNEASHEDTKRSALSSEQRDLFDQLKILFADLKKMDVNVKRFVERSNKSVQRCTDAREPIKSA